MYKSMEQLQQQELALLERQRAEYARMARMLARVKEPKEAESAMVSKRLRELEAELATKKSQLASRTHASSKVWRRKSQSREAFFDQLSDSPAIESADATEHGESVLRKYSVTASLQKGTDFVAVARFKHSRRPVTTVTRPASQSADAILSKYSAKRASHNVSDDSGQKAKRAQHRENATPALKSSTSVS